MPVDPKENLSRYLFSKNNFGTLRQIVHYTAFMPPPGGCLSVFRIAGLSENEIWDIGNNVSRQRDKKLFGRADIAAVSVYETGLSIDPDGNPPRHANIIGWPDEASGRKLAAIEMAQKAELHLA